VAQRQEEHGDGVGGAVETPAKAFSAPGPYCMAERAGRVPFFTRVQPSAMPYTDALLPADHGLDARRRGLDDRRGGRNGRKNVDAFFLEYLGNVVGVRVSTLV
jgi:hypothetical protein